MAAQVPGPQPPSTSTWGKRTWWTVGGVLVLTAVLGEIPSGSHHDAPATSSASPAVVPSDSPPDSYPPLPSTDPAAIMLAADDGSTDVAPYTAAIDALAPDCTEDRTHVAGLGYAGAQDLEQHGITDETGLTVLQHLRDAIPAGTQVNCQSILTAYLVERDG